MSLKRKTSRREWLTQTAATIAAGAAAPSLLTAQTTTPRNVRVPDLLDQLNQKSLWRSPELRLLRRISFGMNATEVARIQSMGYSAYLEEQLNPSAIDDQACTTRIAQNFAPLMGYTTKEAWEYSRNNPVDKYTYIVQPFNRMTVERAIFSRRQLHERMTEFWSDHFYVPSQEIRGQKYMYDRDVIRANALGKVSDLIRTYVQHVSMLSFLDNGANSRFGLNENLARELMELHTVGWDGGYTQADVVEVARILTGWTYDENAAPQFDASRHDYGAKMAFGLSIAARPQQLSGDVGKDEALAFVEMLIAHPATKRYIARKLLVRFVSPTPTSAQIQAVVNSWAATGGDIKSMLRVVFSASNMATAPARFKRPFHLVVSAVRGTNATVNAVADQTRDFSLDRLLDTLGHGVCGWETPDGYPDRDDFWTGGILDRWRAVSLDIVQSAQTSPGRAVVDIATFTTTPTPDGVVAEINRRLFGGEMSTPLAAELRTIVTAGVTSSRVLDALRLAVMSPEFQFY